MNISREAKRAVAIAAGIGVILGSATKVFELAKNLNGWHVLALFCALVLVVLGLDSYRLWLNARFAAIEKAQQESSKELNRVISGLGTQFDSRLANVHKELKDSVEVYRKDNLTQITELRTAFTAQLKDVSTDLSKRIAAEQEARIAVHSTASLRAGEIERRLKQLEEPLSSAASDY